MNKVVFEGSSFGDGETESKAGGAADVMPHRIGRETVHLVESALERGQILMMSMARLADDYADTVSHGLHVPAFEARVNDITGTHEHLISPVHGGNGFEVAGTDTIPASTGTGEAIGFNSSDIGYASSAADHDWFRLHVVAGISYTISADKLVDLTGQLVGLDDPFLTLRNSSGGVLATNNDHGGTLNAEITFTATSTGDVYLDVNSNSGLLGYYTVGLVDTIGNTTATASALTVGGSKTGLIEDSSDSDWFSITLVAGKSYDFSLTGYSTDGLADPYLELRDAAGNLLTSNDDVSYPGNINSSLHFTATTGGTYYLAASGSALASTQDEAAGIYTIRAVQSNDVYADNSTTTGTLTPGHSVTSVIDSQGDADWFAVTLEAGYIYNFALNGAGGSPLNDPYLELYDANGQRVAFNDDGGAGLNSALSFYAASGGTYYISAESFPNDPPATNIGGYTLSMGARVTPTVDGDNNTTWSATALTVGVTQSANIDTPGDHDWYTIELQAGQGYDFDVKGLSGFNGSLSVYDSSGALLARNDDFGSGTDAHLDFETLTTGNYYLVAEGSGDVTYGGYTITAAAGDRPLLTQSIDWGAKLTPINNVVKVYFANNGETYDGQTSEGWTAYEIQQAMAALTTYSHIVNLTFVRTTNAAEANFKLVTTATLDGGDDGTVLAYMNPPGTTNAGVGVFATDNPYWSDHAGGALDQGGIGFTTLVHELGHGLGLAHPFDNGGTSTVMTGVTDTYDYSGYGWQNQGVYTVMAYNDGWPGGPFHTGPYYGNINGYSTTPMAIDIAALQAKYGANTTYNSGGNTYYLDPGVGHLGHFESIWDTGGTDKISAAKLSADQGAVIDLRPANMYYTDGNGNGNGNGSDGSAYPYNSTSGGAVSRVDDVDGGLTIAAGVVIERADGHAGRDTIYGNDVGNVINGNGGSDTIYSGGGNDSITMNLTLQDSSVGGDVDGGAGNDTLIFNVSKDTFKGVGATEYDGQITFQAAGIYLTVRNVEKFVFTDGTYTAAQVVNHPPEVEGALHATMARGGEHVVTTDELNFHTTNGATSVTYHVADSYSFGWYYGGLYGGYVTLNGYMVDSFTSDEVAAGRVHFVQNGAADTIGSEFGFSVVAYDGDMVSSGRKLTMTVVDDHVDNVFLGGTSELDRLYTGRGNDTLIGLAGDDTLDGGKGADIMKGGIGNDTYYVDSFQDQVIELKNEGTDTVISSVQYIMGGSYVENATLTGTLNSYAVGNALDNILFGNSGNNNLTGGAGNDRLDGGAGSDGLRGGVGNDVYYVDNLGDFIVENKNEGTDLVYSTVSFNLGAQYVENLTLRGSANINGLGNALANTITGNAGNNLIDGRAGADVMRGGAGDDIYYVDNAGDKVIEAKDQGTDSVYSSVTFAMGGQYIENLYLTGSGNINGTGTSQANTLVGNSGKNTPDGGAGSDTLTGGAGADIFFFGAGSGKDTITDFSASQNDSLNLHACSQATAVITQVGNDTVIDLGGGNVITLTGTHKADVISHITW